MLDLTELKSACQIADIIVSIATTFAFLLTLDYATTKEKRKYAPLYALIFALFVTISIMINGIYHSIQ